MEDDHLTALEQLAWDLKNKNNTITATLNTILAKLNNMNTQPPTQVPVPLPVALPPPVRPALSLSQIKPSPPNDFNGDRVHSHAFLTSILLFASIVHELDNEQTCIHWVLSFFKSDQASIFAQRVIHKEANTQKPAFTDWDMFVTQFKLQSCPKNEAMNTVMALELSSYHQNKRSIGTYIDNFKDLITCSLYVDPIIIIVKFRHGDAVLSALAREQQACNAKANKRLG